MDMPDCPVWNWCPDRISAYSLHALFSILRACPSMEQLCVFCTYNLELENSAYGYLSDSSDDKLYGEEFALQEFEGVGYELPCLKMVRIIEFSGRKEEKKLLEFLAGKAAVLESMCLHYVGEIEEEINEIQREIHAFHKASPHVEVSFVEFNEDKVCPKHEDMFFSYMVV